MRRIGIIGATGWLGKAMTRAFLQGGIVRPQDLVLLNRSGPTDDFRDWPGIVWAADAADLLNRCDLVILSIRPQDFPGLDLSARTRLVVSVMAGVPMDRLTAATGSDRIVRTMPNAAAEIRQSYTPWLASGAVTDADRAIVRALLRTFGTEDELASEDQLDLLTALSGSGAALPALLATALLDHAGRRGLPPHIAERAVQSVICGGSAMLQGRIAHAPALVDAYIDYRGTTAAALDAARAHGFDRAVAAAIDAGTAKARAMSDAAR